MKETVVISVYILFLIQSSCLHYPKYNTSTKKCKKISFLVSQKMHLSIAVISKPFKTMCCNYSFQVKSNMERS